LLCSKCRICFCIWCIVYVSMEQAHMITVSPGMLVCCCYSICLCIGAFVQIAAGSCDCYLVVTSVSA
jgi:hypothetical protein